MGRTFFRSWPALVLGVGLVLLPISCLTVEPVPSPTSAWLDLNVKELQARYEPELTPWEGMNSEAVGATIPGQKLRTFTKHLSFTGVQQNERHMAEVLGNLQTDLLALVRKNGAEVRGEVRVREVDDLLKRFEFEYRLGEATGRVRGEVKPGRAEGYWDLDCLVEEGYNP